MTDLIWILQVLASLIFFANKVLLLVGARTGWWVGAVAAVLAFFYFYLLGLYVYTALEFGLFVLMVYGYFKKAKNELVEAALRMVMAVVMMFLTAFAFRGFITIVELLSSLGMLWGTYFLAHRRAREGWFMLAVAHMLGAYLGFGKGQAIFTDFQIASAIVALVGAFKK